ncbi:sugar transporter [Shewanella mangrovi]|uniref:Sugar transporter n=1 Tax=Shewanella mangrovi TaxID=1515746 RepID=A0A094JAG6_9GAMM|nr:sugar transporter [Shewanella mangrovi]
MKKIIIMLVACISLNAAYVSAASISPQMIQQFKNLPRSEQERIARQYGIDPSQLSAQSTVSSSQTVGSPEVVTPRDAKPSAKDDANQEKAPLEEKIQLQRFGYEMFAGAPTTFAPTSDTPIPTDYMVGPGDTINVQLFGKESAQYNLTITRNGTLQFPELGPINAVGLTFSQLRDVISEKVKQQMIGVQANITMGDLRSIRVFIAGDAYKPGSYTISSLSTITQALFVSGGVSDIGSLRNIQLKRAGKVVATFDLYDLLLKGDSSHDVPLRSGDVIFIPAVGPSISVDGDVQRPAIYELKPKETLAQVLQMAAGVTAGAYPKSSTVERYNNNGLKSVISVDLTSTAGLQFVAQDGDYLRVKSASSDYDNAVTIIGAVVRPGAYQWQQGQKIASLLPSIGSDLLTGADLNYGLVIRETNKYGDIEVLQFSPAQAISAVESQDNLTLAPKDKIVIFNAADNLRNRYELNKLVNQRIKEIKVFSGTTNNDKALTGGDLFKSGFELASGVSKRTDVAGVVVEEQQTDTAASDAKIVASEVEKMLMHIFDDKDLIKVSAELNRNELLYPILAKLKRQTRAGNDIQIAAVNGQVRFSGPYPVAINATVADLITAAGGLSEGAYTKRAELSRVVTTAEDSSLTHQYVNLEDEISDKTHGKKIQSRDVITVMRIPEWQESQSVEIRGEVKFPGVYSIRRGETLEDVLQRAGGFTDNAYLSSAVFVRDSLKKQEEIEIRKFANQLRREIATKGLSSENSSINYADAQQMLNDLESIPAVGRLVIDLPAISLGVKQADLQLENKDILYVPSKKETVSIVGEVQHPSSHRYKDDLTINQYIKLAGGMRKRADDERVYVIKADGSVMLPDQSSWFSEDEKLSAGDTIVVPLDTEYKDNLTLWSQVTGIIYNSAVALAALGNL